MKISEGYRPSRLRTSEHRGVTLSNSPPISLAPSSCHHARANSDDRSKDCRGRSSLQHRAEGHALGRTTEGGSLQGKGKRESGVVRRVSVRVVRLRGHEENSWMMRAGERLEPREAKMKSGGTLLH